MAILALKKFKTVVIAPKIMLKISPASQYLPKFSFYSHLNVASYYFIFLSV